jgi:threonine dehydratase
MQLPNLNGVRNAMDNLKDVSIVTPLELNERLSNEFNSRVFFKREDVQKVRSFKIRGAFNKIKSLNSKKH